MAAINRKFKRFKILIVFVCLFAVATLIYFQRNVTRVLISISEATIRSITTVAVNDAIYYTLNDALRYEDLITIERDAGGGVMDSERHGVPVAGKPEQNERGGDNGSDRRANGY